MKEPSRESNRSTKRSNLIGEQPKEGLWGLKDSGARSCNHTFVVMQDATPLMTTPLMNPSLKPFVIVGQKEMGIRPR